MCEEKLPEAVYRELLRHTRVAVNVVGKLMKSEDEEIQFYAVGDFLQLSNLAVALAEALGEEPEPEGGGEMNPLARRVRLDR